MADGPTGLLWFRPEVTRTTCPQTFLSGPGFRYESKMRWKSLQQHRRRSRRCGEIWSSLWRSKGWQTKHRLSRRDGKTFFDRGRLEEDNKADRSPARQARQARTEVFTWQPQHESRRTQEAKQWTTMFRLWGPRSFLSVCPQRSSWGQQSRGNHAAAQSRSAGNFHPSN